MKPEEVDDIIAKKINALKLKYEVVDLKRPKNPYRVTAVLPDDALELISHFKGKEMSVRVADEANNDPLNEGEHRIREAIRRFYWTTAKRMVDKDGSTHVVVAGKGGAKV